MIKAINIKETLASPKTTLDKDSGVFEILGNSYMNNPIAYYAFILEWLEEYVKYPLPKTRFVFDLEYVNSSSLKILHEIIKRLTKIKDTGNLLEIDWHYSDDDEGTLEMGQQFSKIAKFPFNYIIK